MGNTVIVVEHDEDAIRNADHIIDIGIKAGIHGGNLIAEGSLKNILKNKNSLTAKYLNKLKQIETPTKRRKQNNDKCGKPIFNRSIKNKVFTDVLPDLHRKTFMT